MTQNHASASETASDIAVEVSHVQMSFNMASEQLNSLKEYFIKLVKHELFFKEFIALDDISLTVKKGDVYGIVGTNGSGKSTLLKIVAGVLEPTKGTCTINGNIAPLIELGAGFDMELTARENIYLNGALLGYSREYVDEHFDEIVDFAELRDFLELPMKNYSSGMVARIAFAVATVIVPDILIVDEALSVGDVFFQEKCERRINNLIHEHHTTVLFVSHSIAQVERVCRKAVWIEKGHLRMNGDVSEVCDAYRNLAFIEFVTKFDIMDGADAESFDAYAPLTYAEAALALWRCAGQPNAAGGSPDDDIATAFSWALETGVIDELPSSPGQAASRGDAARMVHRFALLKRPSLAAHEKMRFAAYSDAATVSDRHVEALAWCVDKNVLGGKANEDGTHLLAADDDAQRVALAKMITTLYQNVFAYPPDVEPTAWYVTEGYYDYVVDRKIMSGYTTSMFGTFDSVTRSQMITILWRAAGSPTAVGSPFRDVPEDAFFSEAVAWATQEHVLLRTDDLLYPERTVTRKELALLAHRFVASRNPALAAANPGALARFADADTLTEEEATAFAWCIEHGLMDGVPVEGEPERLDPDSETSRIAVAKMITIVLRDLTPDA